MFSTLKRILGTVTIREDDNNITIEGVAGYFISRDIVNIWRTSRINDFMFSVISGSKIVMPKFFALEFSYMMAELVVAPKVSQQTKKAAKELVRLLQENTWLGSLNEDYPTRLNPKALQNLKFTPKPYQADFFRQYDLLTQRMGLYGYMLAAPPGSGKTFTGIALMEQLGVDAVIVVTLKNTISDPWEQSLDGLFKVPPKFWSSNRTTPPSGTEKYYVCHYEYLLKFLDYAPMFRGKRVGIILDESHNLNEIVSNRTQTFLQLCKTFASKDVLWMSGTPIKAVGTEMIPFLTSVDPLFKPHVQERFKKIFGVNAKRAYDIMAHRIGVLTYRIPKSDIIDGAPIYETIKVVIPDGQQYTLDKIKLEMIEFVAERMEYYNRDMPKYVKQYQECLAIYESQLRSPNERAEFDKYKATVKILRASTDYRYLSVEMKFCNDFELGRIIPILPKPLNTEFRDIRSIVKYVSLKVRGECLGRILGRRRIECHVAMVEHCRLPELVEASLKKTLIFTSFVEVIVKARAYLVKEGFSPLEVYGDTNKDIKSILQKYATDPKLDPMLATYKSLSTGVPVTSANTVILMNAPFRPHEKEQAISRSFRLGQDTQVYVYEAFLDTGAEPNISTRSNDILEWAQSQINAIMGDGPVVGLESLDLAISEQSLVDVPELDWATLMEGEPHINVSVPKTHAW